MDWESDNVLRQRALEHIRTPAISGNIAHYIQWAKEIPGVHKVKVFDLVRGNGTVDVVLIANDNEPAPESLVTDVAEYIESQRPIGADVLVTSAEAVELQVEAAVLVKSGYTESMVTARLQELLDRYCEDTAFLSTVVSYLGIVALVFDCPGVVDVENARINGQEKSLILTARQFPGSAARADQRKGGCRCLKKVCRPLSPRCGRWQNCLGQSSRNWTGWRGS